METARTYNKYLIAALVLKLTAVSVAAALIISSLALISPLYFGLEKSDIIGFLVIATGLLFLVPNSFLAHTFERVAIYSMATVTPMGVMVLFFSRAIFSDEPTLNIRLDTVEMGLATMGIGLCSFAPLSLMAYIKGLNFAKKHGEDNPDHGLWLMLGGGSGAAIIAGVITAFTLLMLTRASFTYILLYPFYLIMVPSLVLIYLAATIIRAIKQRSLKTSLVYTSYTVIFFAYTICIVWLPFWLFSLRHS